MNMVGVFLDWKPHLTKPCPIQRVAVIIRVEVQCEAFHGLGIMSIERDSAGCYKRPFACSEYWKFLLRFCHSADHVVCSIPC